MPQKGCSAQVAGWSWWRATLAKVQNLIRRGFRLLAPQVLLAVIKAALLVSPPGMPARADNGAPNPFTLVMLGMADRHHPTGHLPGTPAALADGVRAATHASVLLRRGARGRLLLDADADGFEVTLALLLVAAGLLDHPIWDWL
jgi:hypothetical protein